jgi:DNA-binding CsgD family transcriptional regulator
LNTTCKILVVEPSVIVQEGISAILSNVKNNIDISFVNSLEEVFRLGQPELFKMVLLNPSLLNNSKKSLNRLLTLFGKGKVLGLVSNVYDRALYENFADNIFINDERDTIEKVLSKHLNASARSVSDLDTALSERELDVLKLLAVGKANKEIAEDLFISVHTVVSHRKNISSKLGVKSTAALVIYAVANGLIQVDGYSA